MLRAVAALSLAAATTLAPGADAVEVCVENNQLTFSPPLTLDMKAGTVTIAYQGSCPELPGLTPRNYSGVATLPYFGSCVVAFIAEGGQSGYVAGRAYAFVRGSVDVKGELLTPDGACPISTARGSGVRVQVPEVPAP